jgi:hypothetical protein
MGESAMREILIADIILEDDATATGGVARIGETLADFIDLDEQALTLADINKDLIACGIKPITLDQIIISGTKGK